MTTFATLTVFAALPVSDLASATQWYSALFGREPDARPAPHIAEFYLAQNREPEAGTLQLNQDPDRAGGGLVTLNVADISGITRSLDALGITLATQRFPIPAETVSEVTVGTFVDPDGNAITVVQPHA